MDLPVNSSLQEPQRRQLARLERGGVLFLVLTMGIVFALHTYRNLYLAAGSDFPEFHAAGRYVLEHGKRSPDSILRRYLPSVDVAWVPLAALPLGVSGAVLFIGMIGVLLLFLRTIAREFLCYTIPEAQRVVLVFAVLAAAVALVAHFLIGAFHLTMIWLMVLGTCWALRGHAFAGGLALGLSVWIKLLPLMAVGYLIIKRRYAAAGLALATAATMNAILSVAGYGWRGAWDAHVTWLNAGGVSDLRAALDSEGGGYAQTTRNQSMAGVFRRLLAPPASGMADAEMPNIAIADLSSNGLRLAYFGASAVLAGILVYWWRRSADRTTRERRAAEVAVLCLATLWFAPVSWTYSSVAAIPALAVVLGSRWELSLEKKIALALWMLASFALASTHLRAVGVVFWASLVLAMVTARTADHELVEPRGSA